MTDVMTARTEHQVLLEITRIFKETSAVEQHDRVPPRAILRVNFTDLTRICGAKYARTLCRRCGFAPDDGGKFWWRGNARGEGEAVLDLDSIEDDLRLAIDDLDPLGLTTPYQRGRVEPA
jgi:hypothetical protein